MSGFEVIGVVLGVAPLIVTAIEKYEKIAKLVTTYRKYSKIIRKVNTELAGQRVIFQNECIDFGLGLNEYSLNDKQLQQAFYQQVICRFQELLPSWEKIYGLAL